MRINGVDYQLRLRPWVTLLDLLRDRLDLTGTKKGCDHGQCGACTVIVDGRRINACLALAVAYDCADITTVEGLGSLAGNPEGLHPLQQAFIDCDAFQCGYCTPGQLCSAVGMMNEPAPVNAAEIRERMSGNICRCAAYPQIVEAVSRVVFSQRETAEEPPAAAVGQGEPQ
ncbi:(2Fe-2S)-binding protein [Cupriavidus sp. AU9028]|uniref:(2Fe-2S)-binding protein n=1 Tax=Cupriavidus sp. AU9028 TaxID=2871157 RepID=UPI0021067A6A|nr:(2Fe-2S)-binding protein [Cupriavidus sp. AU9028]